MRMLRKDTKIFQTKRERSGGFGLVEAVVAVSIAAFSIFAVWKVYTDFLKLSLSNPSLFQASFLAEEGIEAVKFMRNLGWAQNIAPLSSGVSYSLVFDGAKWEATTTHSLIDGQFDRRLELSDARRDLSGDISLSGTPDPDTRKAKVSVSWLKEGATSTREISTYVTNIFNN